MTAVKAAYEAADELRFAPGVDREKVADAFREALKLAVASTEAGDAYYRRTCEEKLIEAEAASPDEAVRERARAMWIEVATRRVRRNEEREVFGLALLLEPLGLALPAAIANDFKRGWAEQRIDVLATWSSSDGDVEERWTADFVPSDPHDAYLFARVSHRKEKWAHAAECARAADVDANARKIERWAARLLLLGAQHRLKKLDPNDVRALLSDRLAMKKPSKSDRFLTNDTGTAALAILAGVPAQEDDEELVSSFVKAWQKSEGRFAVRALLLSAMTTSRR